MPDAVGEPFPPAPDAGAPDDLTISIGSLGNYPALETCLQSIYAQDTPGLRYRVWVVYNGAEDEGVTARIERAFPQVTIIKQRGPLGYCATHNLVLRRCLSRYVLILDDDTILLRGTLSTMIAFMDAHPEVGMAGCKTLNGDGTFQRSHGLFPSLRTEVRNAVVPDSFWPARLYRDTSSIRDVEWLNGSFMLVRSEIIRQVGALDEHYYTYVCEPDWCYRIRRAGWRVVYVPTAAIVHVGGEHSINAKQRARNRLNLVRYHANRYYFFHKHYGPGALFLLRAIMLVGLGLRLGYYALVYLSRPERRPVAAVRLAAFWESLKLSFSAEPYRLPGALADGQPTARRRLEVRR